MPEVILVEVQECDRKGARMCGSETCLVARAILRQTGAKSVSVGPHEATIDRRRFDLDPVGIHLVERFDVHDVQPERMPKLPITITLTEIVF